MIVALAATNLLPLLANVLAFALIPESERGPAVGTDLRALLRVARRVLGEPPLPPRESIQLRESEGQVDSVAMAVAARQDEHSSSWVLAVSIPRPTPGFRSAVPGGGSEAAGDRWGDRELQARGSLRCDPELGLRRIAGRTRQALIALLRAGWTLEGGQQLSARHLLGPETRLEPEHLEVDLRHLAAFALGLTAEGEPVAELLQRARSERRTSIRVQALRFALDRQRSDAAVAEFRADREEPVRRVAIAALLRTGRPVDQAEIALLMASPDAEDQQLALEQLGPGCFPEAAVIGCLRNGAEPTVRLAAAQALAQHGTRNGALALQRASRDKAASKELRAADDAGLTTLMERLGNVWDVGGLSIAPDKPEGGELSVARVDGGLSVSATGSRDDRDDREER